MNRTNSDSKSNLGIWALVALNPFIATCVGLSKPRDPTSRNLVWVFAIFYGAVFYIAESAITDSVRYAEQLTMMHSPGYNFDDLRQSFFVNEFSYQDFYQPIMTFLVSRVTGETWLLFGLFGVLFGYVYSRNIWFLIDRVPSPVSLATIIVIVAFSLEVSIGTGLNGVRMWTAVHVFIFGFFNYLATRRAKYLVISLLTPLIHFSFILPCVLLVTYFGVRRFSQSIYLFFVGSFIAANIEIGVIRNLLDYLPLTIGDRALGYVDRTDITNSIASEGPIWFLELNDSMMSAFMLLASTFLFLRKAHLSKGVIAPIFLLGMMIYGMTNLVAYVPSAVRFYDIGRMLILAAVVLFIGSSLGAPRFDRQIAISLCPLLSINIALGVRFMLEFASIMLIVGNFFVAPFIVAQEGLYEILGSVF